MTLVELYRGYHSHKRLNGEIFEAGVHEFEPGDAKYFVENGFGEYVDVVEQVEIEDKPRNVNITKQAQVVMDSYELTADDFPDVDEINKPLVDAHVATLLAVPDED